MVTPSCDRMKPSRDVHIPRFGGLVDVFSDPDECTRETVDTCIQK
jgi:hypothetical protein